VCVVVVGRELRCGLVLATRRHRLLSSLLLFVQATLTDLGQLFKKQLQLQAHVTQLDPDTGVHGAPAPPHRRRCSLECPASMRLVLESLLVICGLRLFVPGARCFLCHLPPLCSEAACARRDPQEDRPPCACGVARKRRRAHEEERARGRAAAWRRAPCGRRPGHRAPLRGAVQFRARGAAARAEQHPPPGPQGLCQGALCLFRLRRSCSPRSRPRRPGPCSSLSVTKSHHNHPNSGDCAAQPPLQGDHHEQAPWADARFGRLFLRRSAP
jgi:hypothetical protein